MNNHQFRARIRKSLANENLQIALDANTERRLQGRMTAFESLPDWRERRQKAHAIRADVIEQLDTYLEQFISNATQNGVIVHRARNEAEAIEIFLEIAGAKNASSVQKPLVAKSKSMVSEEINLNHALEAEGIRVVETDLGEYIVQLRHERPAHIITPAVHLRRSDVGQLFHEKLGIPYTEDIPTLTNTARKVLREVFLTADVGVSGVNFAIADTGGFCIVTNEGNGRMVTTLPPVHIALMGMERLVRNLDDLALLLSLLARFATTQKLSVYTQLIHKPLAHQQRHIIILDNGRSRLRNSPLKESLFCIRCGACLNACPVFRELGGHAYKSMYSGPIGSVISAGLFGSEFVPLAQASSLCGACKEACPVDIDLPKLLTRVRAGQAPTSSNRLSVSSEGGGLSWMSKTFLKIYSRVAPHPRLFALSQKFAWLGTSLVSPFSDYVRLPAFTGWGYSKDLPRFAGETFRERWRDGNQVDSRIGAGTQVNRETGAYVQVDRETIKEILSAESATPTPLAARFVEELSKVNGNVIHTTPAELTDKVLQFLQARGIDCIHLEPRVLDEEILSKAGISIRHAGDAAILVGVTKAVCGLADTGSILEADGEGGKLQASLLPAIHLAVLKKSDIYPSLNDAIHLTRETRSAVFITGPSRTADIEMTLTIGVHGPGELHVLLVDD
jgi:L-lactate dehydrogenase complex protein LldF